MYASLVIDETSDEVAALLIRIVLSTIPETEIIDISSGLFCCNSPEYVLKILLANQDLALEAV